MKRPKLSAHSKAPLPRATIIAGAKNSLSKVRIGFIIFLVSTFLLVLLGVGGGSKEPSASTPHPTPHLTTLPEVYKKTIDNAHCRQANRYETLNLFGSNVTYIGIESRWSVIDAQAITELCTKSITASEFAELVQERERLEAIVNTGEEALQNSPSGGRDLATGRSDNTNLVSRQWIFDMVVEQEKARARQSLIDRMTAYMRATNHIQELIDLVPLMVDLGEQTGNDARICPVTSHAESSGGRQCGGTCNPYGIGGKNAVDFVSWEAVVRYYFNQISSYGCNGDVWHIAFIWYDSSDPGGRATSYANNIVNSVRSI